MTTSRVTRALQLLNAGLQLALLVGELLNLRDQAVEHRRDVTPELGGQRRRLDESVEKLVMIRDQIAKTGVRIASTRATLDRIDKSLQVLERRNNVRGGGDGVTDPPLLR